MNSNKMLYKAQILLITKKGHDNIQTFNKDLYWWICCS